MNNVEVTRRNNVRVTGKGSTPMLFAHGFGCDQNMWRFLVPAFEADYKIILFDYVGCGKSDIASYTPERYANLNGYAQDVIEVCDALELNNVLFVGHSVSGMIGLLASFKRPDLFSCMIQVGPSPRYINDDSDGYTGGFEHRDIVEMLDTMERNYIGWANFLAPAIMKNEDRPELAGELTESFCSTDPLIARQFAEVTFFSDNRRDVIQNKVPCLILQCSDDLIAPEEVGHYLADHMPLSTLKVMNATGHCPHLSAPEETIRLIKEYLDDKIIKRA